LHDSIAAMLAELQPHSIVFNGNGLTANSVRWIGNERGDAPDPNWSTGISGDAGDPNSPIFCPAECDTTLQIFDRWFWVRKEIHAIAD
jgi:alpha-L-fucosidase